MKLPSQTAGYEQRVNFGRYVATRLRQAKREDQAATVEQATSKVKAAGRKVGDLVEPLQAAMALRDAADGDMDEATQDFRLKLASRSLNAAKEPPYTQIFPQGVGYYIAAPLAANETRYKELVARVEANLAAKDELRAQIVPAITAGLEAFTRATAQLAAARTAAAMAGTECDAVEDEWDNLMTKIYGVLISETGKKAAERFFPRSRRAESETVEEPQSTPEQ
jgi:hypothetical protein